MTRITPAVDSRSSSNDGVLKSQIAWRLPPEESHSDWTIEILVGGQGGRTDMYHVHKVQLAVGPRRSEYFARLFQGDRFAESETRTSRITLHELAAEAFPAMLDYIYAPWKEPVITKKTVTALHQLGHYFELDDLSTKAAEFHKEALRDGGNAVALFQHANALGHEDLLHAVAARAGEEIEVVGKQALLEIKKHHKNKELLGKLKDQQIIRHIKFWTLALSNSCSMASADASLVAAWVCLANEDTLRKAQLVQLTDECFMSDFHPVAALQILTTHQILMSREDDDTESCDDAAVQEKLAGLRSRCINGVSQRGNAPKEDKQLIQSLVSDLPQDVLSELVVKLVGSG